MNAIDESATREERRTAARKAREHAERVERRSEERRRRLRQLVGALLASATVVVAVVLVIRGGMGSDTPASAAAGELAGRTEAADLLSGIPQDGIVLGDPKAPITIVEYADLQCPACASFSASVLPQVVADHVRTGDARLEFRNLHFLGPDSTHLARFAAAAGRQGKLFDVATLVYANLGPENSGFATEDFLRSIAAAVPGLDVERALRDADSVAVDRELGDARRLAEASGVTGTPTIFVGRSGGRLEPVEPAALDQTLQRLAKGRSS